MCDSLQSSCWPSCFSYPHNLCGGYNLPQWIILQGSLVHHRYYLLLGQCEFSTYNCLTCSCTVLPQLSPGLTWLSPHLFHFLRSCVLWHAPQHLLLFYIRSWNKSEEENKLSMYNLWPQHSTSYSVLSLWHALLQSVILYVLVHSLSTLYVMSTGIM